MDLSDPRRVQYREPNFGGISKQLYRDSICRKSKATNNRLVNEKCYYFSIQCSSDSINCNSSHIYTIQHLEQLENLEELG